MLFRNLFSREVFFGSIGEWINKFSLNFIGEKFVLGIFSPLRRFPIMESTINESWSLLYKSVPDRKTGFVRVKLSSLKNSAPLWICCCYCCFQRLMDIERLLERARQEGSIGYPEDNKYLLEDVEHAQETVRYVVRPHCEELRCCWNSWGFCRAPRNYRQSGVVGATLMPKMFNRFVACHEIMRNQWGRENKMLKCLCWSCWNFFVRKRTKKINFHHFFCSSSVSTNTEVPLRYGFPERGIVRMDQKWRRIRKVGGKILRTGWKSPKSE